MVMELLMTLEDIRDSIKESVYGADDYITKLDIKLWVEEVNTTRYFGLGTEVDVDWLHAQLATLNT